MKLKLISNLSFAFLLVFAGNGFAQQKDWNSAKSNTSTAVSKVDARACEQVGGTVQTQPDGSLVCANMAESPTGKKRRIPAQGTTVPFPCAPQGSGDPLKGLGIPSDGPKTPCPTLQ
uniref:hypothetical protein n=1 Tax=Pararhizobium sp. IMCC3301 TaxID=3067904 RepID=UPI002742318C|nr:hypothetical protein [Pararhizobium sp. IMCC3301]